MIILKNKINVCLCVFMLQAETCNLYR